MANNSNNSNNLIPDDQTIVNLVQQHLVSDIATANEDNATSTTTGTAASDHSSLDNHNTSPPTEAEIPIPYHLPGAAITHDIYTHANSLVMQAHSLPRSRSLVDLKKKSSGSVGGSSAASSFKSRPPRKIATTTSSNSGSDNDSVDEFENLDKPGGFRRFHVYQQYKQLQQPQTSENTAFQELFRPDSVCSVDSRRSNYQTIGSTSTVAQQQQQPRRRTTRHFLEYLAMTSVINQFAGEDLSDSEEDDEEDQVSNDLEGQLVSTESTLLLPKRRHRKPKGGGGDKAAASAAEEIHKKANVTKTIFLLFKAFIGSGILFLPKAFSNGGLLFSIITMWVMGAISLYCFLLLLDCKKYLVGSYGDMGGHLYGPWMRNIVLFSIAISQVSICSFCHQGYIVLMSLFFNYRWDLCVVVQFSLYRMSLKQYVH